MANLYDVLVGKLGETRLQLGDEGWTVAAFTSGAMVGMLAGTFGTLWMLGKLKTWWT